MTKSTAYLLIPIVLPLLASSVAHGQEGDAAEAAASEPIDEITVTAPETLSALKSAMDRAQDETFEVFNTMIDDPAFHIICRLERPYKDGFDPIPVHREKRVCATRFIRQETQDANNDYMNDVGIGQPVGVPAHRKELEQKFNDLIIESPEFRKELGEYVVLEREYEAAKEEEMSKGFFSRLFGSKKEDSK